MSRFSIRESSNQVNRIAEVGLTPIFNANQLYGTIIRSDITGASEGNILIFEGNGWTSSNSGNFTVDGLTVSSGTLTLNNIVLSNDNVATSSTLNISKANSNIWTEVVAGDTFTPNFVLEENTGTGDRWTIKKSPTVSGDNALVLNERKSNVGADRLTVTGGNFDFKAGQLKTTGNFYVGTSTPESDIQTDSGEVRVGRSTDTNWVRLQSNALSFNRSNHSYIQQADTNGNILFVIGAIGTEDTERMRLTSDGQVGIMGNPTCTLSVKAPSYTVTSGIGIQEFDNSNEWRMHFSDEINKDFNFTYNTTLEGYIDRSSATTLLNFTGQHRCLFHTNEDTTNYIGLIIESTGDYINMDNSLLPTINDSLPVVQLCSTSKCKKVFGVLSQVEDDDNKRSYATGKWNSVYEKPNINERRIFANSVGEGAMWVCNINGAIQNGDYVTTCTIPGYGQLQTEEYLGKFTVAKLTCDCDFSLTKIVKQKLKVVQTEVTDEDGVTSIIQEIDYGPGSPANGNLQYVDDLDDNGQQQLVFKYQARFLEADGSEITEAEYNSDNTNRYVAMFVGCSYHAG